MWRCNRHASRDRRYAFPRLTRSAHLDALDRERSVRVGVSFPRLSRMCEKPKYPQLQMWGSTCRSLFGLRGPIWTAPPVPH